MTHKDIYTKFMIEYDKANVTSSYPSLTEYEVATVLDKAYNALIAQKVTGNNYRRIGLEGDLKAITDLAPLIKTATENLTSDPYTNVMSCNLPDGTNDSEKFLYFISAQLTKDGKVIEDTPTKYQFTRTRKSSGSGGSLAGTSDFGVEIFSPYFDSIFEEGTFYTESLVETKIRNVITSANGSDEFDEDAVNDMVDEFMSNLTATDHGKYYGFTVGIIETVLEPISGKPVPTENDPVDTTYYFLVKKNVPNPYDGINPRPVPVKLVNHDTADKFIVSSYNMPWIKIPISYIEDYKMFIVYDPIDKPRQNTVNITYIKTPNKFVKDISTDAIKNFFITSKSLSFEYLGEISLSDTVFYSGWSTQVADTNQYSDLVENDTYTLNELLTKGLYDPNIDFDLNFNTFSNNEEIEIDVFDSQGEHMLNRLKFKINKNILYSIPSDLVTSYFWYESENHAEEADAALKDYYTFECNDTVAEELISLAVAFALENVESQRLNSKLNMRGLES